MSGPNGKSMREHDVRVDALLRRRKFEKFHRGPDVVKGTPTTWQNPLDELCAREDLAKCESAIDALEAAQEMLALDVLPEPLEALIRDHVTKAFAEYEATLVSWFFDQSPHPLQVLRRLFLYARKKNARLIWNMSYRDLGELFNVSYETLRVEAKGLFRVPCGTCVGRGQRHGERCPECNGTATVKLDLPGGATKPIDARLKMKAAARGNTSRRDGAEKPPVTFDNPKPKKQTAPL